ncbi:MAG: type II toxin-antitoxin system RelE/ParE family toxin [Treponema sp.]|nr:type II toxin-antitoxin system RelE/ParE family toxin [Treponema sp.]
MKVMLHREAEKYLDRLPEPAKGRIHDAIDGLEEEPPEGDIRPYIGNPGLFRLKVGSFRVLFRYRENDILVTHIESRGQVYGKKNAGGKR